MGRRYSSGCDQNTAIAVIPGLLMEYSGLTVLPLSNDTIKL